MVNKVIDVPDVPLSTLRDIVRIAENGIEDLVNRLYDAGIEITDIEVSTQKDCTPIIVEIQSKIRMY